MRRFILGMIWMACVVGALFILIRMVWCIFANPDKAFDIAVALDRTGNKAANGSSIETISSRANRARGEGRRWGCLLCRLLDRLSPNHCRDSAGV